MTDHPRNFNLCTLRRAERFAQYILRSLKACKIFSDWERSFVKTNKDLHSPDIVNFRFLQEMSCMI